VTNDFPPGFQRNITEQVDAITLEETEDAFSKPPAQSSWEDAQKELHSTFESLAAILDQGLTPDELEKTQYVKYHHRTGLNSFLSENFPCKFYYDGEEWSSAQHAYQVRNGE
jgi:hypothetical protein